MACIFKLFLRIHLPHVHATALSISAHKGKNKVFMIYLLKVGTFSAIAG